jgi:hypothetical protein
MVAKVGDLDDALQLRWLHALEGAPSPALTDLTTVVPGRVVGPLVGGNLAVLAALVGTPFAPPLDGSVLFLEDIGERPYRIDRMLTTLTHAGWFEQVRGVAFGAFTDCAPGVDGVSGRDVLVRHAEALGLPCVLDVPAGHVDDNRELPLGRTVTLDATARNSALRVARRASHPQRREALYLPGDSLTMGRGNDRCSYSRAERPTQVDEPPTRTVSESSSTWVSSWWPTGWAARERRRAGWPWTPSARTSGWPGSATR